MVSSVLVELVSDADEFESVSDKSGEELPNKSRRNGTSWVGEEEDSSMTSKIGEVGGWVIVMNIVIRR